MCPPPVTAIHPAPRSPYCSPRLHPSPLPFRRLSLNPLEFSSHGNPWRPHPSGLLIPENPGEGARCTSPAPYHAAVCCCCCSSPSLGSPVFPTQKPLVLTRSPIPPGPSASPYPIVVPKHDVTAECPVDVQVYLRDFLGGVPGPPPSFPVGKPGKRSRHQGYRP